jgi:hypothetical protein
MWFSRGELRSGRVVAARGMLDDIARLGGAEPFHWRTELRLIHQVVPNATFEKRSSRSRRERRWPFVFWPVGLVMSAVAGLPS